MNKKYILTKLNQIAMGFFLQDGKVESIKCYEDDSKIGNIYIGRVSNIVESIKAAFVDIDKNESCYLPLEDYESIYPNKLKIGDLVPVQICKDKIKSKQATVTTNLSITGKYIVVQRNHVVGASAKITDTEDRENKKEFVKNILKEQKMDYGAIIRTEGFHVNEDELKQETIKLLCKLNNIIMKSAFRTGYTCMLRKEEEYVVDIQKYIRQGDVLIVSDFEEFADEEYVKSTFFNSSNSGNSNLLQYYQDDNLSLVALYGLQSVVDKALSKKAFMKSGAYLVIEPTEAMVVIDVNSGKSIKGKATEEALHKINMEAAKEIARQLRLRNLSGMILIDFINVKSETYQNEILEVLRTETKHDEIPTVVVDITRLGIVEMTRKKVHRALYEIVKNT